MSFLDRLRGYPAPPPFPEPDRHAVPLTPAQAALLVEALNMADRLDRTHRSDLGGEGWTQSTARAVSTYAGVAAALGHTTVPVPATDLHLLGYTAQDLERWAPSNPITRQFRLLLTEMDALSGVARVKGWTARHKQPGGYQWDTAPVMPPAAAPPAADATLAAIAAPGGGTVRIRLEGSRAELDAHEAALRRVLTIPDPASRDYPNRHGGGFRRYLESTGTSTEAQ